MTAASKTGDMPAFPLQTYDYYPSQKKTQAGTNYPGLTIRQYYAGQALAGLCAASAEAAKTGQFRNGDDMSKSIVESARSIADQLIAALADNDGGGR